MAISGAGIASYISAADGNSLTAATWGLVDPVLFNDEAGTSSTTFLDGSKSVAVTTTYQTSATGTETGTPSVVDGIAIKVNTILGSTGTISVALDQAGTTVSGSEVAVNVTDMKALSWVFIKFATPITLTASTAYSVKVKTSTTGMITLCCSTNGTFSTIHRMVRTTATAVPQNGASQNDNMYVIGDITAPATVSTRTVTWNNTSDTYPFNMISVAANGVLTCQTTASTNYSMRVQNDFRLYGGAIFNVGSSGTAFPSTSTFLFTLHNTAQPSVGGNGIIIMAGGVWNTYGASKTPFTFLTADSAAAATTITVADVTGWNNGDKLGIAPTTTTTTQREQRTVTSIASLVVTIPALTYAHLGTSPKIGEVQNLTRNITIQGRSSTQQGYMQCKDGAFVNAYYTEFTAFGASSTNFRGIYLNSTLAGLKYDFQYCSFHDFVNSGSGITIDGSAGNSTINILHSCFYAIDNNHINVIATTTTLILTVSYNCFVYNTNTSSCIIDWSLRNGTLSYNYVSGGQGFAQFGAAIGFRQNSITTTMPTIDSNTVHSCADGVNWYSLATITLLSLVSSNWTTWCCNNAMYIFAKMDLAAFTVNTWTSFSNTTTHLAFRYDFSGSFQLTSINFQAGTTPATPYGIIPCDGNQGYTTLKDFFINNSNIGDVSSHSSGDINIQYPQIINLFLKNCKIGSTGIVNQSNQTFGSAITSDRHNQVNSDYKIYLPNGTVSRDTVLYSTASPSVRATPISSSLNMTVGQFYIPIPDGTTATVSLKVRRSTTASGDAASHNGSYPQLIVGANPAAGITANAVLATATSASNGAWETLSGTIGPVTGNSICNIFVVINGTTGWVNIDDITSSVTGLDLGQMAYAVNGQAFAVMGVASGVTTTVTKIVPHIRKKVI